MDKNVLRGVACSASTGKEGASTNEVVLRTGPFDLLVDYVVLDDLRPKNRDLYV